MQETSLRARKEAFMKLCMFQYVQHYVGVHINTLLQPWVCQGPVDSLHMIKEGEDA